MGTPFENSSTLHRSKRREKAEKWANKSEQTRHPGNHPIPPSTTPPEEVPPADRKKPAQNCLDNIADKRKSLTDIFIDKTGVGNGKPPSKPKDKEDKKPGSGNKRSAWTALAKTWDMLFEDAKEIESCMKKREEEMNEQDRKHKESVEARRQWENDVNTYEKQKSEYEKQLKRHEEAKEYYREFAKNGQFPPESPPEDWENRPSVEDIKKGRYHTKGTSGAKKPSPKPPSDDSYGGNRKNPTGGDGAWLPDVLKDPDPVPHDWHAPMKKPEKKEESKDPKIPYRRITETQLKEESFPHMGRPTIRFIEKPHEPNCNSPVYENLRLEETPTLSFSSASDFMSSAASAFWSIGEQSAQFQIERERELLEDDSNRNNSENCCVM